MPRQRGGSERVAGAGPVATADRLWTSAEAARYFGMGVEWVRQNVPAVRLGRRLKYQPDACREYARQHQTSNDGDAA